MTHPECHGPLRIDMKATHLANEIELIVLAYFQERIGFQNWWDSLDPDIQASIEDGLILEIARCLKKNNECHRPN